MKLQTAEEVLRTVLEQHWKPGKAFPISALHRVAAKKGLPRLTDKDYTMVLRAMGFEGAVTVGGRTAGGATLQQAPHQVALPSQRGTHRGSYHEQFL